MTLYYCEKCKRAVQENLSHNEQICDYCKNIMYPVPQNGLPEGFDIILKDDELGQILVEGLVKPSPEFDRYLYHYRREVLAKSSAHRTDV